MASGKIQLTPSELLAQSAEMTALQQEIDSIFGSVSGTLLKINDSWSQLLANNFIGKINSAKNATRNIVDLLGQGAEAARTSATTFENIDKAIAATINGVSGTKQTLTGAAATVAEKVKKWWQPGWSVDGSVWGGSASGEGTGLFGVSHGGEASYDILTGKISTKNDAKWNISKGDASVQYGISAEGSLISGSAEGHYGYLNGSVNGSVGNVGASGEVGFSLFKDGKFTPNLKAKASAEASVAKGSAEVSFGDDEYNAHVKGDGKVLTAKAEAEVQAGRIEVTDENGDTKVVWGAKGKAGAEAYLAEGKVSGGFTLFGVDIDIGVAGKAGGAGASVGFEATTDGFKGNIAGGLGVGGGLELKIDWSDADFSAVTDIAEDVGKGIAAGVDVAVDVVETVGKGVADGAKAVGNWFADTGKSIGTGFSNFFSF